MAKAITRFMARDKTFHDTMENALAYEGMLDIYKYVDDNPIYCGSSENFVDGQALGLWLQVNPSIFMKYLHGGECPQGQDDVEKTEYVEGDDEHGH